MALTIKEIENAKPLPKKYKMADGGGLCLLVAPSGAKLWVWRYRFNGAEKNMHFGEYPRVTLKDARELHFAARKLLGTGINPVADRKAEVESKQMAVKAEQRQADNSLRRSLADGGVGGPLTSLRGTPKPFSGAWRPTFFLLMVTSPTTW